MGRKSKIEAHPQRNIIIKRLVSGDDYSGIIRDFPILTWDDLDYYRDNKLESVLSKSPELKAEIDSSHGDDTLAEVRMLKARALEILAQAQDAGDLKTALMGIREARGCLELVFKAEGRIQEQSINIYQQNVLVNNPEWIQLRSLIITALDNYPEAKQAVVYAIDQR